MMPRPITCIQQDEYVRRKRSKSILCLPIVKQTKLVGALYLENNLTPGAFTPDRVTVLQLLASQAAISLENAGPLYRSAAQLKHSLRKGKKSAARAASAGTFSAKNSIGRKKHTKSISLIDPLSQRWGG